MPDTIDRRALRDAIDDAVAALGGRSFVGQRLRGFLRQIEDGWQFDDIDADYEAVYGALES